MDIQIILSLKQPGSGETVRIMLLTVLPTPAEYYLIIIIVIH